MFKVNTSSCLSCLVIPFSTSRGDRPLLFWNFTKPPEILSNDIRKKSNKQKIFIPIFSIYCKRYLFFSLWWTITIKNFWLREQINFIMIVWHARAVNTMNMQNHLQCQHPDFLAGKAANASVSSQNAAEFKQCLKQISLSCPWKSWQRYKVHC